MLSISFCKRSGAWRMGTALLALSLDIAIVLPVDSAIAQTGFPNRLIRIVVPFAPGGGTDLVARTVGDVMARDLAQTVIIENKPGAGTVIGSEMVAKSAADGYTLLMATFAHAVNPSLVAKLPYTTEKAFAPVALIGRSPNVLVVRADKPLKNVKEIIAAANAAPGRLSYGSQGNGTSAHLAGALFENLAKVQLIHAPYRGASPAITDLLGGQIDMMFATAAAVGKLIESGKLRAIAVTTATRSPSMPSVPTIAESGVPGYVAESWYGLYAPAGTPRDVIARLNASANLAAQSDAFHKRLAEEGLAPSPGTPEDLDRYVRGEEARWRKLVQQARITTD
jgi:tripartite-type tricarboxylate transporter receptor subunit TctC